MALSAISFLATTSQAKITPVNSWDAIIIGSGLGGLTAASLLARRGKRVLILERHSVAGGFTHTFSRKGFEWDVGVHYVGQVENPSSPLRKVFDYVTDGKLEWAAIEDTYDRAVIDGRRFDFKAGKETLLRDLIAAFPGEERALRRYFRLVSSTSFAGAWFFGEKTMPPWLSRTLGRLLRWRFSRMARKTTLEVLTSLTRNRDLIAVLCTQCGDYGLSPSQSSFGIHAVVIAHYLDGASYPVGGADQIPHHLVQGIREHGGEVRLKSEVERILIENGKAVGVHLKNGETHRAPDVISGAGVLTTFQRLWPKEVPLPKQIQTGLGEVSPSTAHLCLYVGLDGSDEELLLPKHNLWIYDDPTFNDERAKRLLLEELQPSMAYISFPSAKDPAWPDAHPRKATVQIITACPYELVERWNDSSWMKRGPEYLALKSRLQETLLERLYRELPHLKGRVQHCELSTPISTKHFANYGHGEIYGLSHTPARFQQSWLRPETPLPGLYLTGQDIVTVGVGGALFSGVLTASRVLNVPMVWEALRGTRPAK